MPFKQFIHTFGATNQRLETWKFDLIFIESRLLPDTLPLFLLMSNLVTSEIISHFDSPHV